MGDRARNASTSLGPAYWLDRHVSVEITARWKQTQTELPRGCGRWVKSIPSAGANSGFSAAFDYIMSMAQAPARRPATRRPVPTTPSEPGRLPVQPPRRAPSGAGRFDAVVRCGLGRPMLASLLVVSSLSLAIVAMPIIGPFMAVIAAIVGMGAVVTSGLAWLSSEPRDRLSWLAAWLGSVSMMVGLVMFASGSGQARATG